MLEYAAALLLAGPCAAADVPKETVMNEYRRPSDEELRKKLTPEQCENLRSLGYVQSCK